MATNSNLPAKAEIPAKIVAALAYGISERKIELSSSNRDVYEMIVEVADDFSAEYPDKAWSTAELTETVDTYLDSLFPHPGDVVITDDSEVIDVQLCPNKTPIAYELKFRELVECAGMKEDEAREYLLQPIQLELIYHYGLGLFAVESEAVDATEIYSPYNGREIPKEESDDG